MQRPPLLGLLQVVGRRGERGRRCYFLASHDVTGTSGLRLSRAPSATGKPALRARPPPPGVWAVPVAPTLSFCSSLFPKGSGPDPQVLSRNLGPALGAKPGGGRLRAGESLNPGFALPAQLWLGFVTMGRHFRWHQRSQNFEEVRSPHLGQGSDLRLASPSGVRVLMGAAVWSQIPGTEMTPPHSLQAVIHSRKEAE